MADVDLRCGFLASYHILTRKLDTDALLPVLVGGGLISPLEKETIIQGWPVGSVKTDRLLMIIHRRGKGDPSIYRKYYELLSTSGQLLDGVLAQIEKDSRDPEVKARFEQRPSQVVPGLTRVEASVAESLTVDEFLPHFISLGIVTTEENEAIRSKSLKTEQATEMIKCIKQKGKISYGAFIDALLDSETHAVLGERLKNEKNVDNAAGPSRVLESNDFRSFLHECEESANSYIAEIARTFYKMGFEAGIASALQTRTKAVTVGAASGPPPPTLAADTSSKPVDIAEKLKAISDKFPEEVHEETRKALLKLIQTTVFTVTREGIRATCASVLIKYHDLFQSGWQQISFVYYAMFQVVLKTREESGEESTESKEEQIANYVFPTLVDLGLYKWMEKHGGMEKFDCPVSGDDAKVVVEPSCMDPET